MHFNKTTVCRQGYFLSSVLVLGLLLSGCATQPHRARQEQQWFNQQEPAKQARLLEGKVETGDSRRAVYVALGTPALKSSVPVSTSDHWERWVYEGNWVEQDGQPRFLTRADFDLPRQVGAEKMGQLRIDFLNGRVQRIQEL